MATQGFPGGVNIVVLNAVLLAGLFHNGSDLEVVGLDDPGEEMVGGLVVQGTCENRPKPAPCGVVLCRGNLKLCPANVEQQGYE